MDKGKLFFTCGPARCGKSTFAKQWLAEGNNDRIVVNSDLIRLAIHGQRYNHHAEPLTYGIESIILKAHLLSGNEVLFDETNTTEASIRKILKVDRDAQPIYINATTKQCKQRALDSGQNDLVEKGVIDRHFNNLYMLAKKYAWDASNTGNCVKLFDQTHVEKIVNKIREEF